MPTPDQHPSMAEQLDELIAVIENAGKDEDPGSRQIAEKGRHILLLSQELARDLAAMTESGAALTYRRIRRDTDALAGCVRERPLTSVAVAGMVGALLVCLMPSAGRRRYD